MNEALLHSLMRLFAIIVSINREAVHLIARNFVEAFLTQEFNPRLAAKYLAVFDEYSGELAGYEKGKSQKKISVWSVKLLGICDQIVEELHIRQRFMILLSLLRFSKYFSDATPARAGFSSTLTDAVRTVGEGLLITEEEFETCSAFIIDRFYNVPHRDWLLIVSDDPDFSDDEIKHLQKDNLSGQIIVLRIPRADTYLFQYTGRSKLHNNGKYLYPRYFYLLPRGSAIRGEGITPVYYSDIASGFITYAEGTAVDFLAREIEFHFRNSPSGIQRFSFQAGSGELVGIIGGSGTGKSTLLKVLNGSLKLDHGDIYINGHHLVNDALELEGIIGYIPQDDLLIEELTVYQNLWFNARLCLDGHLPEEIHHLVTNLLNDLDLFDARDLKVGSPLNKYISGGQRKRLNIALELIREPHILFVDEPTSGLSSNDSENMVSLLKEQAMSGKLVVANIHQPSSDLFKQFDKLLVLDRGGYPVYFGNPTEGITYFKEISGRVDADESECPACGNTNPDEILQVIEARNVDEYGEFTSRRKTPPSKWYRLYREKIESKLSFTLSKSWIPYNKYLIPGRLRQFLIYFRRNMLSKIADRQFISIALLIAPLLAVILGFFSKYVSGDETDPRKYIFSQNENLPAYLFMSVVVSLFIGLIVAAEEIIKDRKILERESFLNLNRTSYLLSKITFLFMLSGIQMCLFVCIGNWIMEIRGMTFSYWLVLFSTACFANLLGLNISDGLNSVVAIYVVVPFLLVPQILLAGVIVEFDKLHYKFASIETVPVSGDLMASRWAYEALAVNQFANNRYQKEFFDVEMLESNVTYDLQFLTPALIQELQDALSVMDRTDRSGQTEEHLSTAREGLASIYLTEPFPAIARLEAGLFSPALGEDAIRWLRNYQAALEHAREELIREKDRILDSLTHERGGIDAFLEFKRSFYNEKLADLLLNRTELHKIVKRDERLLRKMEPVYMRPERKNGRSHFYAAVKMLGGWRIPALGFNVAAIWLMTVTLFITLRYRVLKKFIRFIAESRRYR